MKVLMTGASGFLGRHVVKVLQSQGIEVVAIGRATPPSGVQLIKADLLNTPNLDQLVQQVQAPFLLHFAWYTEHGKYWDSPLNLRWSDATTRLVEAFCFGGGRHVVVSGTCAEYDWDHAYCQEDSTPLTPRTLYGTAKDATRRLTMAICAQHQVSCAWGRVFFPYGLGESPSRLIPSLIDAFRGDREPFGVNAKAFRDFLHADDVAHGLVTLLTRNANGAYNLCSGEPTRLAEVVTTLASLLGVDPGPILARTTDRPGEPPLLFGESTKLRALGWEPTLTLSQGLARTIQGDAS